MGPGARGCGAVRGWGPPGFLEEVALTPEVSEEEPEPGKVGGGEDPFLCAVDTQVTEWLVI